MMKETQKYMLCSRYDSLFIIVIVAVPADQVNGIEQVMTLVNAAAKASTRYPLDSSSARSRRHLQPASVGLLRVAILRHRLSRPVNERLIYVTVFCKCKPARTRKLHSLCALLRQSAGERDRGRERERRQYLDTSCLKRAPIIFKKS